VGLRPDMDPHAVCENGWTQYRAHEPGARGLSFLCRFKPSSSKHKAKQKKKNGQVGTPRVLCALFSFFLPTTCSPSSRLPTRGGEIASPSPSRRSNGEAPPDRGKGLREGSRRRQWRDAGRNPHAPRGAASPRFRPRPRQAGTSPPHPLHFSRRRSAPCVTMRRVMPCGSIRFGLACAGSWVAIHLHRSEVWLGWPGRSRGIRALLPGD
jgi:hypothetical protein